MIRSWNVLSRGWLAAVLLPLLAFATAPALSPEARLIDVYRLIQAGRSRVALERAEALARDVPLGVYFITSRLDPGQLQDFYGAGALPLNYPNEYDRHQGKTGHGIWLHGVPQQNFARSPQSTDGCVVLANDDMQRLLHDVAPRSTPVLITQAIQWVTPRAGRRGPPGCPAAAGEVAHGAVVGQDRAADAVLFGPVLERHGGLGPGARQGIACGPGPCRGTQGRVDPLMA